MGKHTVTLPDGAIASRNSKTMTYAYAVVIRTDNRMVAAAKRAEAEGSRALLVELERIIAAGDLSVLGRKHTSTTGGGRRGYASVVPGDYPYHWLPDHQDAAAWAEYIDRAVQQIRDSAARLEVQADELDAGPAETYGVFRWSQSAANAAKGADEFSRYAKAGQTISVVPTDC